MNQGWKFESKRHDLSRQGIPTGRKRKSSLEPGFFDQIKPRTMIAVDDTVQMKGQEKTLGTIILIHDGVARVLTPEKRIIEIPLDMIEKVPKARYYHELKQRTEHVVLRASANNREKDPYGEWHSYLVDPATGKEQMMPGTGNVLDWKQLFDDKKMNVEGVGYSYSFNPRDSRPEMKLLEPKSDVKLNEPKVNE